MPHDVVAETSGHPMVVSTSSWEKRRQMGLHLRGAACDICTQVRLIVRTAAFACYHVSGRSGLSSMIWPTTYCSVQRAWLFLGLLVRAKPRRLVSAWNVHNARPPLIRLARAKSTVPGTASPWWPPWSGSAARVCTFLVGRQSRDYRDPLQWVSLSILMQKTRRGVGGASSARARSTRAATNPWRAAAEHRQANGPAERVAQTRRGRWCGRHPTSPSAPGGQTSAAWRAQTLSLRPAHSLRTEGRPHVERTFRFDVGSEFRFILLLVIRVCR